MISLDIYAHKNQIELDDGNVLALNYLGTKYEIESLVTSTLELFCSNSFTFSKRSNI